MDGPTSDRRNRSPTMKGLNEDDPLDFSSDDEIKERQKRRSKMNTAERWKTIEKKQQILKLQQQQLLQDQKKREARELGEAEHTQSISDRSPHPPSPRRSGRNTGKTERKSIQRNERKSIQSNDSVSPLVAARQARLSVQGSRRTKIRGSGGSNVNGEVAEQIRMVRKSLQGKKIM